VRWTSMSILSVRSNTEGKGGKGGRNEANAPPPSEFRLELLDHPVLIFERQVSSGQTFRLCL
jgi:hypothetical protein